MELASVAGANASGVHTCPFSLNGWILPLSRASHLLTGGQQIHAGGRKLSREMTESEILELLILWGWCQAISFAATSICRTSDARSL
jgi:hypothetical protein